MNLLRLHSTPGEYSMGTTVEQTRERLLVGPEVRRARPIFIHGMFRTGGTYVWSKFRKFRDYRGYCEPLHEILARPENVVRALSKDFQAKARHPKTDFYFSELPFKVRGGVEYFDESFSVDSCLLPGVNVHKPLRRYFTHLLTYSLAHQQVPVFKLDRALLRTGWLTANFSPINLLVLRNPIDVWESFKSFGENVYFKAATCAVLGMNRAYLPLANIANRYGMPECCATGLTDALSCYTAWTKKVGDALYPLFFELYVLTTLHSARYADCILDMTGISSNESLKAATIQRLNELRIPISLEDCRIPSWEQTPSDRRETERVEQKCLGHLEGRLPEEFLVPGGRLELLAGSVGRYFLEILSRFTAPASRSTFRELSARGLSPEPEDGVAGRVLGPTDKADAPEMLAEALLAEETPDLWSRWANAQARCGNYVSAIAGFRRCLELEPHCQAAIEDLGRALRQRRVGSTRALLKRCATAPGGLRRVIASSLRGNLPFLPGGLRALTSRLRFSFVLLGNFLRLRSLYHSRSLAAAGVPLQGLSVVGGALRVKELGISISRGSSGLITHLSDAILLNREKRVHFSNVRDTIVASSGDFMVHISSGEEVFILREVLRDGAYNFGLRAENIVVWDIGMNVGIASLYFAARPDVRAVLGFEPFRPTFEAAKENFALNPALSSKIRPYNCGIAGGHRVVSASYLSSWKGSVGVDGIRKDVLERVRLGGDRVTVEKVELVGADCVLKSILEDYPGSSIVAKIDCEGSEYEIMRCLDESNLLGKLSVVMLEWHEHGPQELERILRKRGFSTFSRSLTSKLGLIYAARSRDS